MKTRKRHRYKINVGCNIKEIERVFNILFYNGYVFTRDYRVRDFETIKRDWLNPNKNPDRLRRWYWVITGYDADCEMVFGMTSNDDEWTIHQYKTVSIEEFISVQYQRFKNGDA